MGGSPRFALLSLMLPENLPLADLDGLLDGLLQMAAECGAALAGGNITRSPGPLVVDVTAIGSVKPRKDPDPERRTTWRRPLRDRADRRCRSRPGVAPQRDARRRPDDTPTTGGARGWVERPRDAGMAECVARYCRPEPRVRIGALLGRNRAASACMDLSDGLADAVTQMACAGATGARLDASAVPVHPGAGAWFSAAGRDPIAAAVAGGDDYELLFAVPRRARGRLRAVVREARGVRVTCIGELTADRTVAMARGEVSEPLPGGFTHF